MIKRILLAALLLVSGSAEAQLLTKFGPVNGILVGSSTSNPQTAAAIASNVYGLFGCSGGTQFLNGAGGCTVPAGSGVTSVALTAPSVFAVAGSPVTSTGTLAVTFATGQTANQVLASPNGTTGAVGLRALVGADIAPINLASTVNGGVLSTSILLGTNGGTSNGFFSVTGPATALRTFTFPNASATVLTSNAAVTVAQGGTGVATLTTNSVLLGEGTSNVSSVTLGADTVLRGTASADPVATAVPNCGTATSALSYNTTTHAFGCQTITSGGTGTVTNVATGTGLTGGPITSTGTLSIDQTAALTWTGTQVFSQTAGLVSVNSTTATNAALAFFNLGGTNKVRIGAEGTAGNTITGSVTGDVVVYSATGFNVTTDAGDNMFRIDGAGLTTLQGPTGRLTINSTTATNASGLLAGLGGVNKIRLLAEGTAGASVVGSSVGDAIVYTSGGNIDFTTNSGGSIGFQVAATTGAARSQGSVTSMANGTATTIFSLSGTVSQAYFVTCGVTGISGTSVAALVLENNGAATITNIATAGTAAISVTGQNIQCTQTTGSTQSVNWGVLRWGV